MLSHRGTKCSVKPAKNVSQAVTNGKLKQLLPRTPFRYQIMRHVAILLHKLKFLLESTLIQREFVVTLMTRFSPLI